MTVIRKNETPCGPAIACGAACITLDHEPGQPTSIDIVAAAIKKLFTRKSSDNAADAASASADRPAASRTTAQGHAI